MLCKREHLLVDAVQERASFARTATFVALDLPFPTSVEVVKFWDWVRACLGLADRAFNRVENCGLFACYEHMEQRKKIGPVLVFGVPRLPLPFPPKVVFCGMSVRQKPPRQREARG